MDYSLCNPLNFLSYAFAPGLVQSDGVQSNIPGPHAAGQYGIPQQIYPGPTLGCLLPVGQVPEPVYSWSPVPPYWTATQMEPVGLVYPLNHKCFQEQYVTNENKKESVAVPPVPGSVAVPPVPGSLAVPGSVAVPPVPGSLAVPGSVAVPPVPGSLAVPGSVAVPPVPGSLAVPGSVAVPPVPGSLAVPGSVAVPPVPGSLAVPGSVAVPPVPGSLAVPGSVAVPPVPGSLAVPESLAVPPMPESLAVPPMPESLAVPPMPESLAVPPAASPTASLSYALNSSFSDVLPDLQTSPRVGADSSAAQASDELFNLGVSSSSPDTNNPENSYSASSEGCCASTSSTVTPKKQCTSVSSSTGGGRRKRAKRQAYTATGGMTFEEIINSLLERYYSRTVYPDEQQVAHIANQLRLTQQQVSDWFEKRRSAQRRQTRTYNPHHLPAPYYQPQRFPYMGYPMPALGYLPPMTMPAYPMFMTYSPPMQSGMPLEW